MKRKGFLILGIGLVVLLGVGVFFLFFWQPGSSLKGGASSVIAPQSASPKEDLGEMVWWEDEAGFKFSYPKKAEVDPHPEDEENYAHLELSVPDRAGGIVVWAKDTEHEKIEDWAADVMSQAAVFDTTLGGYSARRAIFSAPEEKMQLAAIDVDTLILIEMRADSGKQDGFWEVVLDELVGSFEFIPLEGETEFVPPVKSTGGSGGGQVIEEPEEVIE
jgi:hypothetical protein